MPTNEFDEELAEALGHFYADPLGYVLFAFPWESESSIQLVEFPEEFRDRYPGAPKYGPDLWACEFLWQLGQEVKKRKFTGKKAVEPIQFATSSGHGIGKSVLTAWLTKWIMDTRPFAKGVITAVTAEQLRTKTWAEIGKWHRMSISESWFNYSSGRGAMSLAHKNFKESWRCDAQTSREENSESFAGLHAANSTPFYIFDEASGIPEKIFEVREGGTTDGEPMIFDFGNLTRNSGQFYEECVGRLREYFIVRHVDSRTVSITNKERIARWIEIYGEDSDFVRTRVKGQAPRASSAQFIATADVEAAQERELDKNIQQTLHKTFPLVFGVDVARFGDDDSVIWPRIGYDARSWGPRRFNGLPLTTLAEKVVEYVNELRALGMKTAMIFVDGTGVGGGLVDILRNMGQPVTDVQFGAGPMDNRTYRFKSDEIWGRMREDIRAKLILPRRIDPCGDDIHHQLTAREYDLTLKGQIHLESKSDMKSRGVASPDIADALALTYAMEVVGTAFDPSHQVVAGESNRGEYDPFDLKRW